MKPADICLPFGIYDTAIGYIINMSIFRGVFPIIMISDTMVNLPVNLNNKPITI